MCDMKGIRHALEKRPDVAIIEDAAHSFEASRDGYYPGHLSDAAIFSFYATKNVTCGEGGAVITSRQDLAHRLHSARLHGMTKGAADRFQNGRYNHWDMVDLGTKGNLPDILAALLPRQIATIRDRLPARHALANHYRTGLRAEPVTLVDTIPECVSAEHIFPIHVEPRFRDRMIAELNRRGVNVAVNYRCVPGTTYYRRKYGLSPADFPASYRWGEGTITLPLYHRLARAEQDHVIASVREAAASLVMAETTQA
jgi:UDP-4-amino-4-deoxy-L-arabinose-oxoglutarate aminotransferase